MYIIGDTSDLVEFDPKHDGPLATKHFTWHSYESAKANTFISVRVKMEDSDTLRKGKRACSVKVIRIPAEINIRLCPSNGSQDIA